MKKLILLLIVLSSGRLALADSRFLSPGQEDNDLNDFDHPWSAWKTATVPGCGAAYKYRTEHLLHPCDQYIIEFRAINNVSFKNLGHPDYPGVGDDRNHSFFVGYGNDASNFTLRAGQGYVAIARYDDGRWTWDAYCPESSSVVAAATPSPPKPLPVVAAWPAPSEQPPVAENSPEYDDPPVGCFYGSANQTIESFINTHSIRWNSQQSFFNQVKAGTDPEFPKYHEISGCLFNVRDRLQPDAEYEWHVIKFWLDPNLTNNLSDYRIRIARLVAKYVVAGADNKVQGPFDTFNMISSRPPDGLNSLRNVDRSPVYYAFKWKPPDSGATIQWAWGENIFYGANPPFKDKLATDP